MTLMLAGLFSVFSLVLRLVCYLVIKALVVLRIVSSIYRSFPLWRGGSALHLRPENLKVEHKTQPPFQTLVSRFFEHLRCPSTIHP